MDSYLGANKFEVTNVNNIAIKKINERTISRQVMNFILCKALKKVGD
tara:strand:+ start:1178 stop:1318 length:141 start_codon:yes stop_codon:yes gene_type:complete